ncbi:MAG TPA: hypothetical protein VF681_13330 [Abditibacteriaceae bacterium]|jgi:ParB/RepB/Spo0J family partition protein
MKSFKQLTQDGTIKRADAMKISYADIHVEPGFNLRTLDADYWEGIKELKAHIKRGGQVPALEVRPREEGGVWLVDGHRRHCAFGELIGEGDPITMISIVAFVGNDADRTARIMTSNEGAKLKPLEIAEGYRRLAALGLSPDEIGRRVCKTRQHVDQMLILATAPTAVQKMVAAGTVKPTTAIDQVRKHGDGASDVLKDAAAKAGGKVTAGAVKEWTPPAKVVAPVVNAIDSFLASIPLEDRVKIEANAPDQFVSVSARELLDVFKAFNAIGEARHAAANKAMAKQGKAAQMQLGA